MVARSELILRWSVYGAAGLLVCLVQGLILQRLDLWGVMPFLYPALAAMVAVWEGAVPCGAVYALCLGAACDLALPGSIPCFYTIAFPLAAMLAGLLTRGWLSSNLLSALAASALGYLVTGLLHAGVLAVTGHGAFVTAMAVAGKEFLITLPALPFLYLLLRWVHRKTHLYDGDPDRAPSRSFAGRGRPVRPPEKRRAVPRPPSLSPAFRSVPTPISAIFP